MHKKTFTLLSIMIFAVTAGLTIVLLSVYKKPSQPSSSPLAVRPAAAVSAACKAFTLDDAIAILGPGTKVAPGNGGNDTTSDTSNISDCSYVTGGANNSDPKSVSAVLLVRSATNTQGAEYNTSMFSTHKPADKQDVPDVGDAAFWDASLSQLNVLQGDTWYIIGNMKGAQANSGTLETSKAIYDQVKSKL